MPRSRSQRRPLLAQRMLELAWSSPYVIAHRMGGSDQRERTRMVVEKAAAGMESWSALSAHVFAMQRSLMREMLRQRPWGSYAAGAPLFAWMAFMRQAERGLSATAAPFHRRATANARRLASVKRRARASRG
jgi:hypothetical protein